MNQMIWALVGLMLRIEELVGSIGFRQRRGALDVRTYYIKQLYAYYYLWGKCRMKYICCARDVV